MTRVALYDAKSYDKEWFDKFCKEYDISIKYIESKLSEDTAILAKGCSAVCAFVNDDIGRETIDALSSLDINLVAMRCAGYNNIDIRYAKGKIHIVRVPAYSPYAVAEHAVAMLLCLNRKLHKAYIRTRDYNFSLSGMTGFDLHGKTVGVVGVGKIGRAFADICKGFGMKILACDPFSRESDIEYTDFEDMCKRCDIISMHCPLTRENRHIINTDSIEKMKDGVFIINTSRGALIDSDALINGLMTKKIGYAALDVYEEEGDVFFEDMSEVPDRDEKLATLLSMPNVIITSHQAFLTSDALENIAVITLKNIKEFLKNGKCENEIF